MQEKLDKIVQEFGIKVRTLLKKTSHYDNNIEFELVQGRYRISFRRRHGNYEVLTQMPLEFYGLINEYLLEMDNLWKEEENVEECFSDHVNGEYSISLYIDGSPAELSDPKEIKAMMEALKISMENFVEKENFEEARRLKERIAVYQKRLDELNQ